MVRNFKEISPIRGFLSSALLVRLWGTLRGIVQVVAEEDKQEGLGGVWG